MENIYRSNINNKNKDNYNFSDAEIKNYIKSTIGRNISIHKDPQSIDDLYNTYIEENAKDSYFIYKKDEFKQFRKKEADIVQLEDTVYQCNKCKSRKIFVKQLQLRSGDEGATTIYDCSNCGNTWT